MKLFTNYDNKEMGPAVPDQDLADLQTNSLPLYRKAAPGDRVPVKPYPFYVTKPYKSRLRDVPSYETHTMKDITNYDNVDAMLYDKDPLMGPGGLLEQMTPFQRSL